MAEVIALAGWPPEVIAYAYALYSRSARSIRQSIQAITNDNAGKFLNTFYFQYGHASIADNAHIFLALEGIPEIAAYELEDEQLWDGQEQSTRYQDFGKGGNYHVPASVRNTPLFPLYTQVADYNLKQYVRFSKLCFERLVKDNPKPSEMKDDAYERNMRARAFDVARYWLFNGVLTNIGQATSARTLEKQIVRLMSSEYPDLRELAQQMKSACQAKPFCPEGKDEPPVAPTLVKYTEPNKFLIMLRKLMEEESKRWLWWPSDRKITRYTKLVPNKSLSAYMTPLNEIIATLLYEASDYPYNEIVVHMAQVEEKYKLELINKVLDLRGRRDPLPKTFAIGQKFQFDICMDRGGERDLHRHRNCVQIHQPLTTSRGWDTPDLIIKMGMADEYNRGMAQVGHWVEILRREVGVDSDYLIPFAYRSGTLYKMHLEQAVYMSELRSGIKGHFSYREIAYQMYEQLVKECPFLEGRLRVTSPEVQDLLNR